MSFTGNDRNFQSKSGSSFHDGSGSDGGSFAAAISAALRSEFGDTPAAVKTVARLAASNERTARNWYDGKNGPSGDSLVRLMRHSNVVLAAVLFAADRKDLAVAVQLADLREHLVTVLAAIDGLRPPAD